MKMNVRKSINRVICFAVLIAVLFIISCKSHQPDKNNKANPADQEVLIDANKQMIQKEDRQIRDVLVRYGWDMTKTGTGLRYLVYQNGDGIMAKEGNSAVAEYTLSLLNGEVIYSSENDGLLEFRIGRGGVPAGLEEGILLLHEGDKAKFVIPSHLAYGLLGDQKKIPSKVTLVYDIHLVELK